MCTAHERQAWCELHLEAGMYRRSRCSVGTAAPVLSRVCGIGGAMQLSDERRDVV